MGDRILKEYEGMVVINGEPVIIKSTKTRWAGYREKRGGPLIEQPGIYFGVTISRNGRKPASIPEYIGPEEITDKSEDHAQSKHEEIMTLATEFARSGESLQDLRRRIENII